MKRRSIIAFLIGVAVGTVVGTMVNEEDKKRIKKMLNNQAKRLKKEYAGPVREVLARIQQWMKTLTKW